MHLAIHTWMRSEPLEATLARIQRLGYASIELAGEPAQFERVPTRALLKKYCIRCWGAVAVKNLATKSSAEREQSIRYMKAVVQMTSELEGRVVTVVPVVGTRVSDSAPDCEWMWVRDGLQEVYELAERLDIRIGIEPLNRYESCFINRADQALAMADAVGPNCGVSLDAFHLNVEEADFLGAIRTSGKRIHDFHVADNNRLAPGQGALDWKAIVETLKAVGYDGALTAEFYPPVDRTPLARDSNPLEKNLAKISGQSSSSEEYYSSLVSKTAETLLPLIR